MCSAEINNKIIIIFFTLVIGNFFLKVFLKKLTFISKKIQNSLEVICKERSEV